MFHQRYWGGGGGGCQPAAVLGALFKLTCCFFILHSLSPSFLPSSCLSFSTHTFSNPLLLLRILSFERYSNTHIFQPFSDLAISALSYFLSVLLFFLFCGDRSFLASLFYSFFPPLSWLAWHVPHHSTFHLFIDFLT